LESSSADRPNRLPNLRLNTTTQPWPLHNAAAEDHSSIKPASASAWDPTELPLMTSKTKAPNNVKKIAETRIQAT
jgi:hypothetical protein